MGTIVKNCEPIYINNTKNIKQFTVLTTRFVSVSFLLHLFLFHFVSVSVRKFQEPSFTLSIILGLGAVIMILKSEAIIKSKFSQFLLTLLVHKTDNTASYPPPPPHPHPYEFSDLCFKLLRKMAGMRKCCKVHEMCFPSHRTTGLISVSLCTYAYSILYIVVARP